MLGNLDWSERSCVLCGCDEHSGCVGAVDVVGVSGRGGRGECVWV